MVRRYIFPVPKRGKQRAFSKPVAKKPAKNSLGQPPAIVRYVRHGTATTRIRLDRAKWCAQLKDFMNRGEKHVINVLKKQRILPEWKGVRCPRCKVGLLGPLTKFSEKGGGWGHRCNRGRICGRRVAPHDFHPIFVHGSGTQTTPLADQATMLFCGVAGCSQTSTHRILPKNHKVVSGVYSRMYAARAKYVGLKQKRIKFGKYESWKDVEADEVDVAKGEEAEGTSRSRTPIVWEQWGGIVERGAPETLVLIRLKPAKTKRRAPGPGAIRKRDWTPIARRWLARRKVILHTDGARTYRMKIPGVKHDYAVHKRKRAVINGRVVWIKPKFSRVRWHNIAAEGEPKKKLWVKTGTQIIDRAWQQLRKHKGNLCAGPHSIALTHRVRSFQWEYWNTGKDLWQQTGELLQFLFKHEHAL